MSDYQNGAAGPLHALPGLPGGPALAQFRAAEGARLLAVCAEPGLGAGEALAEALSGLSRLGRRVGRHDLSRLDGPGAASYLVRLARSVSRAPAGAVVALVDLPASDEPCARRQAGAIRRMCDAGARVALALRPEASQVLDLLPECAVVSSRDLLRPLAASPSAGGRARALRALTHGIAPLVDALDGVPEGELAAGRLPRSYESALVRQVGAALRRSVPDEDMRLRLAMLLLGSGGFGDIGRALGSVPLDSIDYLGRTAPLFDVDYPRRSFRTLLGDEAIGFPGVASQVEPVCAEFAEVVSPSLRVLLERGEFSRALRLFSLPGAEGAYRHVPGFGVQLLDAGGSGVVTSALDFLSESFEPGGCGEALSIASSAVRGEGIDESDLCALVQGSDDPTVREALLFVDARRLLLGRAPLVGSPDDEWSGSARRMYAHCEVAGLLLRGRPTDAMRVLISNPCGSRIDSLGSALLCVDLEVTRILLCDGGTVDEGRLRCAARVLESSSCAGMRGHLDCLRVLRAALSPEGDARQLESCLARAERSGEALVQAVALVAGCIVDLRGEAYSRANVRSGLATAVAKGAGAEFVMRVAQLLGEVARYLMGELPDREGQGDHPDELGEIRRIAHRAMRAEEGAEKALEDDARAKIPGDTLWLLGTLAEGLGSFSALFERSLPMSWRCALAVIRQNAQSGREGAGGGGAAAEGRGDGTRAGASRQGTPIKVTLLGEFGLTVHGVQILDGRIGHRNAQSMLAFLLLQRRATARRQQIVDQIWPESDYVTGSNRVYQATSALRAAIAEVDQTLDPFVLGRSTRSISIDTSMVSCDVDEFSAFAREAVDGEDDESAVGMARRVEQLYAGDLYAPPADRTGFIAAKREELKTLYVDAMVAGSDAALRMGRKRTAARFAGDAVAADDMREDAVIALVNALRADGRDIEADRHCRRYARRVAQMTGRSPSWRFRQVMRGPSASGDARGQTAP